MITKVDFNTKLGGPDAPYRKDKKVIFSFENKNRNQIMRLAIMIKLYLLFNNSLTQKQLAKNININEATLSRFLSGKQLPDAKAFSILLSWCFDSHS